jgi:glycerate kinase
VAGVAKKHGIPTVCLSGGLGKGYEDVLDFGIDGLMSIVPRPMMLEECIEHAEELVEAASARVCLLVKVGMGM